MAIITPRQYQIDAVESIFKYWQANRNEGNPVAVMPVGSGKSLTMALFIRRCFDMYDRYMSKVLVVTHVKELIEQDYEAIVEYWPGAPIGIYSASLNKKQTENRILCCGVQSIAKPETSCNRRMPSCAGKRGNHIPAFDQGTEGGESETESCRVYRNPVQT